MQDANQRHRSLYDPIDKQTNKQTDWQGSLGIREIAHIDPDARSAAAEQRSTASGQYTFDYSGLCGSILVRGRL